MGNTPTPHIGARKGEIAKTVIMAGDPLRVKFMAENYLENPVLFNNVRGMLGYTGTYKGKPVSVMGHGMGCASLAIYTYELFNFYDVETIIRVGSAGSINTDPGTFAPIADFDLLRKAVETCEEYGYKYKVGNLLATDFFYHDNPQMDKWMKMGVLAVEMEVAALYMNAARAGKRALAICTVSDSIITGEKTTAEERQTTFTNMMDVAFRLL